MKNSENQYLDLQDPALAGTYTARDYLKTEPDSFMELIRGTLYRPGRGASMSHQITSGNIAFILQKYFAGRCEVYFAPLDVYMFHPGEDWMDTHNVLQPDILVICDASKLHELGCMGSPDLVVELLMPETAARDLGLKLAIYEEYGVKELWIVHPRDFTVVIHLLVNGKYKIVSLLAKGQILQSPTFPDLKIDLDEVFPDE